MTSAHWKKEIELRFPDGDWFAAGRWRDTALYQRHPTVVTSAMEALAQLVHPEWFLQQALCADPTHPICLGLLDSGYLGFWPAFKAGYDLASLGNIPQFLRTRLLQLEEVVGACSELSAAAALARHGINFDWFPEEGGEFRVVDDVIRYVEVKRPMYESERTRNEVQSMHLVAARLRDAFPNHVTSFALQPDLYDDLPNRERLEIPWDEIAMAMIAAVGEIIDAHAVPGTRPHAFGTVSVAHSDVEMRAIGAGGYSGFYLDNDFEAERVIKRAMKRAFQQLPSGEAALICMDWTGATEEFYRAAIRRLSKVRSDGPQIVGVLVRKYMFSSADIVPAFRARLVENPNGPHLENARVTRALAADPVESLRDPAAPCPAF